MCRLPAGSALPASLSAGPDDKSVISVTWAPDELSVICPADRVPEGATVEAAWRCLRVIGPLDLALTSERLARGLMRVQPDGEDSHLTVDAIASPLSEAGRVAASLTFFSAIRY